MPKAQVMKWGNSLAVRIPKAVAPQARIREGDPILVEARKGCIELRP
jgi:antitoxin MazE